jgi:hypothetical protein
VKKGIFIQADHKQHLGAKIAKHAIETRGKARENDIPVTIMLVEDIPTYTAYNGMEYRRGNEMRIHDPKDLQFFTLSRFMPPELMQYEGRAVVIDPDIFACGDITPLFDLDLKEASIAACGKNGHWDTSMMVLDCAKLTHWNVKNILENLKNGTEDYTAWMELKNERKVFELPRIWNNLDTLTPDTKLLHTTVRITQPWKTGLPIDFIPNTPPKLFGILPRKPLMQLRGTWPTHYRAHPNKNIEELFIILTKEALAEGAITPVDVMTAIAEGAVRSDLLELVTQ